MAQRFRVGQKVVLARHHKDMGNYGINNSHFGRVFTLYHVHPPTGSGEGKYSVHGHGNTWSLFDTMLDPAWPQRETGAKYRLFTNGQSGEVFADEEATTPEAVLADLWKQAVCEGSPPAVDPGSTLDLIRAADIVAMRI